MKLFASNRTNAQLGANGGHHHDADSTKESDDKRLTRLNLMRDIWSRAP